MCTLKNLLYWSQELHVCIAQEVLINIAIVVLNRLPALMTVWTCFVFLNYIRINDTSLTKALSQNRQETPGM